MPDGALRANQNQAPTQEAYGELGCEGTIKLILLPFHPVTAKRSMVIFNTFRKGLLHIASRTYLQEVVLGMRTFLTLPFGSVHFVK